ncbi:MAG: hypothetical protein RR759_07775 [Ruthenibacterium sp.]
MRKFSALLRINFRALLSTFSFGSGKKRALGSVAAIIFLGGLALYMSGIYSFLLGDVLRSIDALGFLLPLMAISACVMALVFTMVAATGIVFSNKDSDFMLSLPLSAFSVMLAKILALYLENLLFCGLWMLPTGVAYLYYGGSGGAIFIVLLLISVLFLPLLPTLLATVFGYVIAFFSARLRRKALITNLLTFGLFGLMMLVSFQINKLGAILLQNMDKFSKILDTWLLPFGLFRRGLEGNLFALVGFLVCLVPFLLITYFFSTRYKKILTGLASHATRSDYKLQNVKAQSQFAALFRKEAGRYFGTPVYLMNTGIGALMMIFAAIAGVFMRSTVQIFIAQMGGIEAVFPIFSIALCLMLATICSTCVSISLEGKTLWILKEAPIMPATLFAAKIGVNLAVSWSASFITLLIVTLTYAPPLIVMAKFFLLTLALSLFVALSGLMVNLLLPKMDGASDTLVVKQSASSLIGILGGTAVVGVGALLYINLNKWLRLGDFFVLSTLFLLVLCGLCWHWLNTRGAQRLLKL